MPIRPRPSAGRILHAIATANSALEIFDLENRHPAFIPEIQTRIRLAEDQEIIALTLLSDGTARETRTQVRIAKGGCL